MPTRIKRTPHGSRNRDRKIPSAITLSRSWDAKRPFVSCVMIGTKRSQKFCAAGANPRDALSSALGFASNTVKKRKGAFAGHRRHKKRRRR